MAPVASTTGLVAVLLVLLAYWIISSVRAYWRLRQFPGPSLAAWSNLWYTRAIFSGTCHLHLSDVNSRYGSLARIAPNILLTSDADLFRKMNVPRSGYRKSDYYKAFRFGAEVENVFSETNNERHTHLRKRVAAGYSGRDIPNLESQMDEVIFTMIESWRQRYLSDGQVNIPMDMCRQLAYLTLDIITMLLFSKPLGWISSNADLFQYNDTMSANLPIMFYTTAFPLISRILRIAWIQRLIAPSVKDRVGMGRIKAISTDLIAERFAEVQDGKIQKHDMTSSFMKHRLTQSEIADGALLAILAGSDTSATTIRTGLISMLTQPRIIRKLQIECDEAGVPKDEIITYAQALTLPYLQACVKESLRFHPVAAGLNARVVPPQGDYHEGRFLPGGTIIGQCAWSLQRCNVKAYGPDADLFRPERWIEAKAAADFGHPEILDRMEKAHELVFGYGEFMCLGSRIALIAMSKIMFEIIRRFEVGFVDGFKTLEKNLNVGLFVQEGMWVRIEER